LFVDPPMYGRESTDHSATASSHHPADTTIATPAASDWRIRRHRVVGAARASSPTPPRP
jgi:hypothetical protein